MVHNKYSKEECISALQEAKKKIGHDPSQCEYKNLDIKPSYQTIADKFGRWNLAKRAAGMSENKPSHLKYQDGPPEILSYTEDGWKELSKNMRFRRRNQAHLANEKIERGCNKCGYDKNPIALEFHHQNPDEKYKDISTMITNGLSKDRIDKEVEKCIVLCSNCHKIEEDGDIYDM
jgi:hypothetical protein